MAQNKFDVKNEKRNFFRIDDICLIKYRLVDPSREDGEDSSYRQRVEKLTLRARLESMSREMHPVHKMIAAKNSKIASYLTMLDKKIDMLSEYLINTELDDEHGEPQPVNIGAGGISFMSASPIMVGGLVELEMVLFPGKHVIFSRANVVSCIKQEVDDANRYRVAVEFVGMLDDVRDLITRHVIKKEIDSVMSGQSEKGGVRSV